MIFIVMALLSFVESAPRAYWLKVGNAGLLRNSTEPGTSPNEATAPYGSLSPAELRSYWAVRSQ